MPGIFVVLEHMIRSQKKRVDERGATAVEYGLLVALIAAIIIAVVALLGQKILAAFNKVNNSMPA